MFCERLCNICLNHTGVNKDCEPTCRAYPNGIPKDAPCRKICNTMVYRKGAKPPEQCPGGFRFEEPKQHKEQWENVLAAERGERDWNFPL